MKIIVTFLRELRAMVSFLALVEALEGLMELYFPVLDVLVLAFAEEHIEECFYLPFLKFFRSEFDINIYAFGYIMEIAA